jgi:hypothetical protein
MKRCKYRKRDCNDSDEYSDDTRGCMNWKALIV